MSSVIPKRVFISYRRRDSSPKARWLAEALAQNFGQEHVYLDRSAIRSGDKWPTHITEALKTTAVAIAIIGPEWLRAQDRFYKRRIDDPDDWVRKELVYCIEHRIPIIPLLVENADLPDREGLPEPLTLLTDYQSLVLRDGDQRETDLGLLVNRLQDFGFKRTAPQVRYPIPSKRVDKLTENELNKVMKRLSNWKIVTDRLSDDGTMKTELRRTYEFDRFEEAIHFMSTASRHISAIDHHPDWENIWCSITVWLTTWDLKHNLSVYDIELAEYLDQLYLDYEPSEKVTPKPIRKTRKRPPGR